jgi:hypothetical protein
VSPYAFRMSEPPTTARGRLLSTYRASARFVEALPARAAFRAATELAELLRGLAEEAADLRARMAERVRREEGLSIRALAVALGLSRSKAGELIGRASRSRVSRETRPAPSPVGEGAGLVVGASVSGALGGDEGVEVAGGDVAGVSPVVEQLDAADLVGEVDELRADQFAGGGDPRP